VNATKTRFGAADLDSVLEGLNEVVAMKGKKVQRFDLRGDVDAADLEKAILGPTGNLRAPAIRVGKRMLVGFQEETYDGVF
jgi:hypothetical protein